MKERRYSLDQRLELFKRNQVALEEGSARMRSALEERMYWIMSDAVASFNYRGGRK